MTVTVVAGPPAAGKTTWVSEQAKPGDLVIDLDAIAGGHARTPRQTSAALREVQRLEAEALTHAGDVWVVRCAPRKAQRDELRTRLQADRVVVMATSPDEAKSRARTANRPTNWSLLIDQWWSDYEPSDDEEIPARHGHPATRHGRNTMSTPAPATDATTTSEATTTDTAPPVASDTDTTDWKAEAEKWQTHARKHEDRAKANSAAAKELETLRLQSMTDQEKAVAAAIAETRTGTLREVGTKLVAAELRAAAAGRGVDVDALLEGVDPSRFLDDDGEPDRAGIAKWVDRIAPAPDNDGTPRVPDLGQGARSTGDAMALNGDPLMRELKSKLGIR